MRYAILADIHANLAAFNAVLDDIISQGGVEKIWCLGDVVGYGPDPHQCIELLCQTEHICVAGNHDWAAIGRVDTAEFNPDAAAACRWTSGQLDRKDMEYLAQLPLVTEDGDFTLVHGSPREPTWEYLTSTGVAKENFACFRSQFCLVGHSHIPLVFSHDDSGNITASQLLPDIKLTLGRNRLIINPGGVGQPRDSDPRASYALYDSENAVIRLRRIPYDIRATQDRMMAQGLPVRLVVRLASGI